jgi:hypothetical protein
MTPETENRIIRNAVVGLARIMPHDYDDAEKAGAFAACTTIGDKAEALLRWKLDWLNSIRVDKPQVPMPTKPMRIRIYDTDNSGAETLRCECDFDEAFPCHPDHPNDNPERPLAYQELRDTGRYWIGGGAAPLVLLMRAD